MFMYACVYVVTNGDHTKACLSLNKFQDSQLQCLKACILSIQCFCVTFITINSDCFSVYH
jgi:hypothetical protein